MDSYAPVDSKQLIFVADCHFCNHGREGETQRRARFAALLDGLEPGTTVYLIGDVFDFFYEYAAFVHKDYFDVYAAIHRNIQRGVVIHFLGGNHDYWDDGFLSQQLGLIVHTGDDIMVEAQGRKLWLSHGDLHLPWDRSYRRIRAIIRHPLIIKMAKVLHPDLTDWIARRISTRQKGPRRMSNEQIAHHLADIAEDTFFGRGNDVFIMGHVHYPFHRNFGDKDFMVVGDWIRDFTFGRLENGQVTLEKFEDVTDVTSVD